MQSKRCPASRWLVGSVLILGYLLVGPVSAQNVPPVEEPYKRFFIWYHDQRSLAEKIRNSLGLSKEEVGRSFALMAGISSYPEMPRSERELKPAAEDLRKLEDYLKNVEFFDEIVLLKDQNFDYANLAFFLQTYFPERLKKFPKSRFLFAYSGHGITAGPNGYLLLSTARSLSDKQHSLNLTIVRELFNEVVELVEAGHYVFALLNSCYSGTFLKRPFGERHFFPKHGGAHAITAGGKELTWHDPKVGTGSIFFEKFFAGLNGQADLIPPNGDGLITVDELATYLRQEIQISTDQTQNPQTGDLSKHGSLGGFFFLNRGRQVARGTIPEWTLSPRIPSGPAPTPSNRPPVARLAAPTESAVETAVLLNASESTDPDGDPLIYTWDFGDGTNAQAELPRTTHRYTSPGTYTVRVTVNDGRGGSNSTTIALTVVRQTASALPPSAGNRPPVPRLTVPERAQMGESVPMDASESTDPEGDPLTYTWDFGDGTPPAKFTFPRPTHAYARAGNYAVTVTVDDGRGGSSIATGPLTIVRPAASTAPPSSSNRPPVARLTVPPEGQVNTAIALDASSSSDPDGDPLTYAWDFGDGTSAKFTFPRTSHRYAKPGNYTVRVIVDDGRGGTDPAAAGVTVVQRGELSQPLFPENVEVLFDSGQWALNPEAYVQLDAVAEALRAQPTQAQIVGHSDGVGSEAYNLQLSQRRAEAVAAYLASQEIPTANISLDWKGSTQPLVPNTTAENRAHNRRVALTLRPLTEHQRLEEEKKWSLEGQQGLPKKQRELAQAYFERGQAHEALGDLQQAIRDYTRSIELAPQAGAAYQWRAEAYSALGNEVQADEDRRRYAEQEAQEKKRQATSAMPTLNQAIKQNPR